MTIADQMRAQEERETMTTKITWSGNETSYERALCAAKEMRSPLNSGRREQLADNIDQFVGRQVWREGRHVSVWPDAICDAAGLPPASPRRARAQEVV